MSGRGLGAKLCLAAGALAGVGWWATRSAQDGMDLRVVCYTTAGVLGGVGLSLLLFGKVNFFGLCVIDLRRERPMFWVGLPGFRACFTDVWRQGALRTHHAGIYLIVPLMLRMALAIMAGWFAGRLAYEWVGMATAWGMGVVAIIGAMMVWRFMPLAENPDEK